MTITLTYLDNSRAFRVLWLAHELGLEDKLIVKKYERVNGKKAVPQMSSESGFSLGKSPFLVDDEGCQNVQDRIEVFESVACMEYLLERYGKEGHLLPPKSSWSQRTKVQSYLSFCETLMLHSLAIVYAQWFTPDAETKNKEIAETLENSMKANVQKDLDLLEQALSQAKETYGEDGMYLANGEFSVADIANAFSCEYVLVKKIGTASKQWPHIEAWLRKIEARPAYKQAKQNAGKHDFTLLDL
ncbi:unnamed protein product [Sympodiomycopsis kandeliae]